MSQFLLNVIFVIYVIAGVGLVAYGFNCYASIYLFLKNSRRVRLTDRKNILKFYREHSLDELPVVTTQLPVFNEANCVERLIEAVCAMDYPKDKHEIQVLDDSTDECYEVTKRKVAEMQARGYDIKLIHRTIRKDYKAGALKEGMVVARGNFLAIFDADFVPEKDFLLKTIPYMVMDEQVGLVQGRWGHLNRMESGLTLAQSIGIDGHFVVEQSARSWGNLFMNFNGTAGVWRRQAIDDAGGWEGDTLTEDMDLSYRSQLAGWKMKFVFDVIVPAELPNDINAFKAQQFRWAKGSIQTAKKILPKVLRAKVPFKIKLGAIMGDLVVLDFVAEALEGLDVGDSGRKSGFTVVDVADRADVHVRLAAALECFLSHFSDSCELFIFLLHRPEWSHLTESNRRPHPYQGCALPTELKWPLLRRKLD